MICLAGQRKIYFATAFLLLVMLAIILLPNSFLRRIYNYSIGRFFKYSVESRLSQITPAVTARLHLTDTPQQLVIIVCKAEKNLEVWGKRSDGSVFYIRDFRILAASGHAGPKLREGDRQVPEGFYNIESLHPNSHFYLALKIQYPSAADISAAEFDGRSHENPGSAIMLHGRGGSIGCIAVDNSAIEEIFYLAAQVGVENVQMLIMPWDFRLRNPPENIAPLWLQKRYTALQQAVQQYRKTP